MPGTVDATFELFLYENIVLVILVNWIKILTLTNLSLHVAKVISVNLYLFKNDAVSPKSFSNKPDQIMKKIVF